MRGIGNERGVVISWLMKLLVGLAIVSVIMFDAGSILVNYFTLDTAANDTAIALSLAINPDDFGTNDEEVFLAAKDIVASNSTNAGDARVLRNGTNVDEEGTIHVKLRRVAETFVVKRISAIKDWARATAEGQSSTN